MSFARASAVFATLLLSNFRSGLVREVLLSSASASASASVSASFFACRRGFSSCERHFRPNSHHHKALFQSFLHSQLPVVVVINRQSMPRRSTRIRALSNVASISSSELESKEFPTEPPAKRKRRSPKPAAAATTKTSTKTSSPKKSRRNSQNTTTKNESKTTTDPNEKTDAKQSNNRKPPLLHSNPEQSKHVLCLPRTRELQLKNSSTMYVLGIDEAGRGPLAGPVVAAAIICPVDIPGVVDSKKITKEEDREALFEAIVAMEDVHWAVAIIDAKRIDTINILQATLEGMRLCASALVAPASTINDNDGKNIRVIETASIKETGCYVVRSKNRSILSRNMKLSMSTGNRKGTESGTRRNRGDGDGGDDCPFFALIDGNRVPKDMPCPAEPVVKGDSKEFSIAAASILAKVTRDRLMHEYDQLYPNYNLSQHKGYPTAAHMKAVMEHGASPIHRRTFAPLKHMEFDENGAVIHSKE